MSQQSVEISSLPLEQLNALKQQLNEVIVTAFSVLFCTYRTITDSILSKCYLRERTITRDSIQVERIFGLILYRNLKCCPTLSNNLKWPLQSITNWKNISRLLWWRMKVLYKSPSSFPHYWHCGAIGKPAMIPLTSSLYVAGQLSDVGHVIVDIGTGYYVKKVMIPLCFLFVAIQLKF